MPQAGQALPVAGPLGPVTQMALPWGQVVMGNECLRDGRCQGDCWRVCSATTLGEGAGDCESIQWCQ